MYIPTEEEKAWAKNTLALLKDKGVITYRDTGMSFIVDKKKKTLTLAHNDYLLYLGLTQQFIKTYYVFRAIGWEVLLPPTN